jgi:Flp pilus assembly protein TadB
MLIDSTNCTRADLLLLTTCVTSSVWYCAQKASSDARMDEFAGARPQSGDTSPIQACVALSCQSCVAIVLLVVVNVLLLLFLAHVQGWLLMYLLVAFLAHALECTSVLLQHSNVGAHPLSFHEVSVTALDL